MVLNFGNNVFRQTGLSGEEIRSETVIVAKDGSGDTDDIQEAINMLPGSGTVFVKEGTYNITSSIIIPYSNVGIIGNGKSSIIQNDNNATSTFTCTNSKYLHFEKLFIYSTGTGNNSIGINLNNSDNTRIINCWFEGMHNAITEADSDDLIIANNYFDDCHETITLNDASKSIITSNRITAGVYGIALGGGDYNNISNNIIESNSNYGIYTQNSVQNTITGNIIRNNGNHGIWINQSSSGNTITGNIISDNDSGDTATYDGIFIDNNSNANIISGNVIGLNDRYQINIDDATCSQNIISGNVMDDTGCTGNVNDGGTNTHPNGASGTNNLEIDDLNTII